jgi:hypothetical protein
MTSDRSRVAYRPRPERSAAPLCQGGGAGRARRDPGPGKAAAELQARQSLPQIAVMRALLLILFAAFLAMTVLPGLLQLAGAPFG